MKLPALAAAFLLALQAQPAPAKPAPAKAASAAPTEALIDRFLAVLPDRDQMTAVSTEIDAEELARLAALNPGKEAQLRPILQADLACTEPAVIAGTTRALRTVARDLGAEKLQKLVAFYEGPAYSELAALVARMEGAAEPSEADGAALAKLMEAYPVEAFAERMNRVQDILVADSGFMSATMACAEKQVEALTAAGLKAN